MNIEKKQKSKEKNTENQLLAKLIGYPVYEYSAVQLDSAHDCNLQLESESNLVGLLLTAPVEPCPLIRYDDLVGETKKK